MKKLLLGISTFLTFNFCFAQFGMDVIVQGSPSIDQRNVVANTSYNGWIYAAFTTIDTTNNAGGITIVKSTNKGASWNVLDAYSVPGIRYEDVDIEVTGTDTNDLRLFVVGLRHDIVAGTYNAFIDRYNALSGVFNNQAFNYNAGTAKIYDLDLASDYKFPAANTIPYGIGLILTRFTPVADSVLFFCSLDAGSSFSVKQVVGTTGSYFGKVSLSYGKSASGSNGRYFAAWERKNSPSARNANIYTSRSVSTVDGSWITPINLDSISVTMIGLCRNPRIATLQNIIDSDSGGVTALVLVDRDYNGDASDYDLLGFYNKRAHFTNFWYRLDVHNTSDNDMQSDVIYDADSNVFHATYFDSTNFRMPYLTNDMNLTAPNTWNVVTNFYNDTTVATNPYPRLTHNSVESGIAAVWTRNVGGNGVAMFDANYTVVFVGIDQNNHLTIDLSAFPNPTSDFLNIRLIGIEKGSIELLNMNGQVILSQNLNENNSMISMQHLVNGTYLLKFSSDGKSVTKKIIKN